ncbi:MAG: FAD-dependent oxidoreductase [Proteobacteria bacterium]|nr:FAD-dependent oxidoreductase [Pseudomonadota bacterium]MBU1697786.1 FAD-dependent oxidoreductase [Pseudomonadota bacterium]
MKTQYHVIIVGSGIAGLSAAATLAGHGLDILIIDESGHTGGQLLRKTRLKPSYFPKFESDLMKSKGFDLVRTINKDPDIDCLFNAQVLGIFKERRLLVHIENIKTHGKQNSEKIFEVQAENLILATGAREKYLPFKGWTLPGVMSLGSAQILMKSYGVLPAHNTLIAGTSPLMMVLASEILGNRGKVIALLDENSMIKKLTFLPLIKNHWSKLLEGAFYTSRMFLNRVPMLQGYRVIQASGNKGFESAIMAKTTPQGDVIPGTEARFFAGALTVGYGFAPNLELPVQAGCNLEYQKNNGGWVVKVDETLESSCRSVYAAGEITGIAGAKKSFIQGKLTAMSILKKMDKINAGNRKKIFKDEVQRLLSLNRQQTEYASFLNHLCQVPTSAYAAIPDETMICRCEEITMGTIKKNIQQGFDTISSLKKATRCGMGRCQGRICGPVIFDIITALTQKNPGSIGCSLSRAPVKNVNIKAFLNS